MDRRMFDACATGIVAACAARVKSRFLAGAFRLDGQAEGRIVVFELRRVKSVCLNGRRGNLLGCSGGRLGVYMIDARRL